MPPALPAAAIRFGLALKYDRGGAPEFSRAATVAIGAVRRRPAARGSSGR